LFRKPKFSKNFTANLDNGKINDKNINRVVFGQLGGNLFFEEFL